MSSSTPPGDLQFEQAEFKGDPVPLACASCSQPIRSEYYQVGQAITCDRCRRRVQWEAANGSAVMRVLKAGLFGSVAAALGAGLYYGVRALTGYEFGLIAVVVGLMVGGAVRAGSGHRGGIPYQLLAMFLTYASIVGTYIPDIWKVMKQSAEQQESGEAAKGSEATEAAPAAAAAVPAVGDGTAPAAKADKPEAPNFLLLLLALAGFAAIVFAAPFLMGLENVIGIIIIGIGLYEAWKMNRKPDLSITGPFRIEDATVAPVAAGETA